MAFIIISSKGTEVGRRGLNGGVTVGRAPDCDLSVHDILLSRHHCRIEPSGRGWVVLDLRSKNGTWLDGERVGRRSLRHAEVVRAGNTTIRFMMGDLPIEEPSPHTGKPRPADPFEAMAGTVVDFDSAQLQDAPPTARASSRMPYPRPIPREPLSYARDGVYSLLEEIASSSWDSIYANASRPIPQAPPEPPEAAAPPELEEPSASSITMVRPVKRPAAPIRHRQLNAPTRTATQAVLPARSRMQVDFSLQVPAARAPRAVRRPQPLVVPAPDTSIGTTIAATGATTRAPLLTRALRAIPRVLAALRKRIAPCGAVILF